MWWVPYRPVARHGKEQSRRVMYRSWPLWSMAIEKPDSNNADSARKKTKIGLLLSVSAAVGCIESIARSHPVLRSMSNDSDAYRCQDYVEWPFLWLIPGSFMLDVRSSLHGCFSTHFCCRRVSDGVFRKWSVFEKDVHFIRLFIEDRLNFMHRFLAMGGRMAGARVKTRPALIVSGMVGRLTSRPKAAVAEEVVLEERFHIHPRRKRATSWPSSMTNSSLCLIQTSDQLYLHR